MESLIDALSGPRDWARYKAYLQSEEWGSLRQRVLGRDGLECQVCFKRSNFMHVHHKTYERLYEELLGDLITLCPDCHRDTDEGKRERLVNKAVREQSEERRHGYPVRLGHLYQMADELNLLLDEEDRWETGDLFLRVSRP